MDGRTGLPEGVGGQTTFVIDSYIPLSIENYKKNVTHVTNILTKQRVGVTVLQEVQYEDKGRDGSVSERASEEVKVGSERAVWGNRGNRLAGFEVLWLYSQGEGD